MHPLTSSQVTSGLLLWFSFSLEKREDLLVGIFLEEQHLRSLKNSAVGLSLNLLHESVLPKPAFKREKFPRQFIFLVP